jgi:hypothetical protein
LIIAYRPDGGTVQPPVRRMKRPQRDHPARRFRPFKVAA